MASRRKKKRNRQLQDFGQNAPTPRKEPNADSYNSDNEETDYDESVYGDVDRDYNDRDYNDRDYGDDYETSHEEEDTEPTDPKPTQAAWTQPDSVETQTSSSPPPLPRKEPRKGSFGPNIKFPPNAKRKTLPSPEATTDKTTPDKKSSDPDELPKKPNLLSFWRKKGDKEKTVETPLDKPPKFSLKEKVAAKIASKKSHAPTDIAATASKKSHAPTDVAAIASKKSKIPTDVAAEDDPLLTKPNRRWRKRIFWGCFILLAFVWALPMIVTKTPLFGVVLRMATGELDGTAEVQSVSCGWFSGISIEGLDVKDRQGNTVIEVPSIEGDRSLLGLIWNSSNLGHFRLEKPVVHVVLGPEGSTNVEQLIAGYLEGPSGDPIDLSIEVVDAKVTLATVDLVKSATTKSGTVKIVKNPKPIATLSQVNVTAQMFADPKAAVSTLVKVAGTVDGTVDGGTKKKKVVDDKNQPGHFEAELALGRENRLALKAKQLLFDQFTPLIASVTSGLELQGALTAQLDCRWGEIAAEGKKKSKKKKPKSTDDLQLEATVQLFNFSATGGPLGTDRVALAQPTLDCQLSSADGVYILRQANLDSEVATLSLDGQVVLDAKAFASDTSSKKGSAKKNVGIKNAEKKNAEIKNAGTSPAANSNVGTSPAAKRVAKQTFQLAGRVNLVRLADMLPTTLHLHDQTKVNSGELTLSVSAVEGTDLPPLASGQAPIVWNVQVQTSDLNAMRHGQVLKWHQPIALTVNAREADGKRAVIDHLLCTSDFLRVEAAGHVDEFNAAASFDLYKLVDKLGGFIDLGGLQMRGQGWANLNWRRTEDQNRPGVKEEFTLDADCQLRDLEINVARPMVGDLVPIGNPTFASSGSLFKQPWKEKRVIFILSTKGRMPADGPVSLSTGELRINSDAEQIVAYLTAPVKEITEKTVWPIGVTAKGQLHRWADRAHALGVASDWYTQGVYDVQLGGSYKADTLKFDSVSVKINQFLVSSPSVRFYEPQLELTLAGHYDMTQSRLLVKQAKCQTLAAVLTADDLIVGTPDDKPMELAGKLGVEGDLTRMQAWIADPRQPSNWTYQGLLKGTADLKQIGEVVSGTIEANVQHLQLSDQAGHRFYEPNLGIAATGRYDSTSRIVEFSDAQLTSSALNGHVKGKLRSGDDPMETDLAGTIDCNMQRLTSILAPYLGPNVAFRGSSRNDVKLTGPMTLDKLGAKAGIGWDSAKIYGFDLGRGQLDFTLANGLVSSSPIQMTVNEGQINVVPLLRVAPGAMQLEVEPGTIVEKVRINPQMCAGGLKYIAPVLADVATVDGRFSIAIDMCRIPIDNPSTGELKGRFIVHSMTIGPGPFTKQFGDVLERVTTAELQKESIVDFQMVNGRVYHKGLELVFPDITIKTHGYVGLVDQTINIVAEMPVPKKWLDKTGGTINPVLQDQKVPLTITGTLSKPRLDQRQLQKAMQQFVTKAATNVFKKEGRRFIDNQINRLLQPR